MKEKSYSKAEPKFKVGDKVRFKRVYTVQGVDDGQVFIDSAGIYVDEDCLELYTEPTQTNDNMEDKELKVNEGVAFLDEDNDMRPGKIIHIAPNGILEFDDIGHSDRVLCLGVEHKND